MNRERGILLDLYDDEKIVTVIRRHWFSFLSTIVIVVVLFLVFLIGSILIYGNIGDGALSQCVGTLPITENLLRGAFLIFGPIYLLSVFGFFYIAWLDYYLDVFVLTNKRILRLEQLVLFGQKASETSYQHVQDVSSQVKGFIHTLLNIGTVFLETAGENENFAFNLVKDPGNLATQILELQKKMWEEDRARSDLAEEKIVSKMEEIHQEEVQENKKVINQKNKEDQFIEEKNIETKHSHSVKIEEKIKIEKLEQDLKETIDEEIKDNLSGVDCDIPVAPIIERKAVVEIKKEVYKDGRQVTADGVIWQSEQEISEDVLKTLNEMEGESV